MPSWHNDLCFAVICGANVHSTYANLTQKSLFCADTVQRMPPGQWFLVLWWRCSSSHPSLTQCNFCFAGMMFSTCEVDHDLCFVMTPFSTCQLDTMMFVRWRWYGRPYFGVSLRNFPSHQWNRQNNMEPNKNICTHSRGQSQKTIQPVRMQ